MIFIDTSALYALMDRDDRFHERARRRWVEMLEPSGDDAVVTSNYVLVECSALLQARLGMPAVRLFHDNMVPAIEIHWVTRQDHDKALQGLLATGRKKLSLVDYSSFAIMRRLRAEKAFTFDRHFAEQGFATLA